MKRTHFWRALIHVTCSTALLVMPLTVMGQEIARAQTAPPIIITEVQTGAAVAGDEFVELYNRSSSAIDITGWQVRFLPGGSPLTDTTLLATVANPDAAAVVLPPHSYYVLYKEGANVSADTVGQSYTTSLSKTDKTIALFARNTTTCMFDVQDAVAWNSTGAQTAGEGSAVMAPADGEKLLQRIFDQNGDYVDTDNNATDFRLAAGTPGEPNWPVVEGGGDDTPSPLPSLTIIGCTPASEPPGDPSVDPPEPPIDPPEDPTDPGTPGDSNNPGTDPGSGAGDPTDPPIDPGTNPSTPPLAPMLTELLPNPGAPRTDASDEFVELFNPNNQPLNISGYVLEAGTTTRYRYTFPEGSVLAANTYAAFSSGVTHLALANTAGQVRLFDPLGQMVDQTATYDAASDNIVWARDGNAWLWSGTSTPNAPNLISCVVACPPPDPPTDPVDDPPASPTDPVDPTTPPLSGLLPVQVTELLPNPAPPQTDANDEFIELYNPNDTAVDISGYKLEVGLTTKKTYTLPEGTVLQPETYQSFFASTTKLALANSGSQVRLLKPDATVASETAAYGAAKDGDAWVFVSGNWQWSAQATPGGPNVLQAAALKTIAAKVATTLAKKSAVKAAATKKASTPKTSKSSTQKSSKDKSNNHLTAAAASDRTTSLHAGVLALIGGFALLYGAYEYRHDVANKIRQFRSNRAARRTTGPNIKRR